MNAKKKNKKAHKPPNPNPPQNVESESRKEEKPEEIQPKCEVKQEIVPVEIVSENLVAPLVTNIKEAESETPKKPKRNKGKNKKNEKEEEKIEAYEKPQESPVEAVPKVEETLKTSSEITDDKEDPLGDTSVVPSARKKKNKKKGQEKHLEELKPQADDKIILKPESIEIIKTIEPDIQELFSQTPETPKEGKKKKNKKKNRNDSEKSDNLDNVLSCTSAFQKILAEDESSNPEPSQITSETKQEMIDTNIKFESEKIATLIEEKNKETKDETEVVQETLKEEPKSKKKTKKDKKQLHKDSIEPQIQDVPKEISKLIEVVTENIQQDERNDENKETKNVCKAQKEGLQQEPPEELQQKLPESQKENESSPKTKAKIAKPVEKKRKGKSEALPSENLPVESSELIKGDKPLTELPIQTIPDPKLEEICTANITESVIDDEQQRQVTTSFLPIDNISIPSDKSIGKKRKKSKSPKPNKNNISLNVEPDILLPEKPVATSQIEITLGLQTEIVPKDAKESSLQLTDTDTISVQKKLPDEKQIIVSDPVVHETPLPSDKKQDNEGFETKTSKKKKKTLKTPEAQPTSEVKEVMTVPVTEKKDECKLEVPLGSVLPPEIDVHSVQTESETSNDVVPEIHFIRSASQQMLDTNNNTIIQEVTNLDEIKLSDLPLTPLIQGSGETPIATPELISSGIRMTEIETKLPSEEKTDIKSKMMEVNQDMEELRLSIERSLAEFAALDKCEAEPKNTKKTEKPIKDKSPAKESKEKGQKEIKENPPQIKENMTLSLAEKEPEQASLAKNEEISKPAETPPVCPARKDNKGKGKSKKKGKQDSTSAISAVPSSSSDTTSSEPKDSAKDEKKEKSDQKCEKSEPSQEKGKQQSAGANDNNNTDKKDAGNEKYPNNAEIVPDTTDQTDFEAIENFEDALTSSIDDVNKTFEMIAKDADDDNIEFQKKLAANKPEISITEPADDRDKDTNRNEKENPVSQPKNLLGHTDIPVQSNRTDYKKEKNKTPNARQAKVKIKDSSEIEMKKQSKESQTENKKTRKLSDKSVKESFSRVKNDNEEYVYKYSFRKVFLQSACHVCNKELGQVRVSCGYCNLIFYCSAKHKDEDWPQHQALCFAVSTLAHMKDQKHIYADAQNSTGQDYRLLRMQMIVSCEKVLKRRLVPWEQEIMLYPRMCADVSCREWRQSKLKDCDGCGQISFCASNPDHFPKSHARWCKSYSLYQRLVSYQQSKGRLEPRLPTRVLADEQMPAKMNEVLAAMYEEKIDMNDIQYASLTQLATAPLTTAYCLQLCRSASGITNGVHKKQPFTIHVVGAELQFEADALNKWETFFLHVRPDVDELRVVLISPALNPGHLPLNLLGKIKLCDNCQENKRRVIFKFEDNKTYSEYRTCEDFINPDIICAFNPSIQRSSVYNGKDPWPASVNSILKLKTPFIVTAYTLSELRKDIARIKQVSVIDFKFVSEPGFNSFASVRPDRNFISDDEMPLLFKNYCVSVVVGC